MIRQDSFGANSGMSDRSCRRSVGRTILPCTGTATNCGGNASNLNRFESLVVFLWGIADCIAGDIRRERHDHPAIGGGGYQISGSIGARYRPPEA